MRSPNLDVRVCRPCCIPTGTAWTKTDGCMIYMDCFSALPSKVCIRYWRLELRVQILGAHVSRACLPNHVNRPTTRVVVVCLVVKHVLIPELARDLFFPQKSCNTLSKYCCGCRMVVSVAHSALPFVFWVWIMTKHRRGECLVVLVVVVVVVVVNILLWLQQQDSSPNSSSKRSCQNLRRRRRCCCSSSSSSFSGCDQGCPQGWNDSLLVLDVAVAAAIVVWSEGQTRGTETRRDCPP